MKRQILPLLPVLAFLAVDLGAQSYKVSGELEAPALAHVKSFCASASGELAAFVVEASSGFGPEQLYVSAADGGSPPLSVAVSTLPILEPVFSADGGWIVYRTQTNQSNVLSVPSDGSAPARSLTRSAPNTLGAISFALTPDGTRVVFAGDITRDDSLTFELYVVPIDGSTLPVRLSDGSPDTDVLDLALSPDSARAVYRQQPAPGLGGELYGVPLDGSAAPVRMSLVRPLSSVEADYVVSHDSLGVVYRQDQDANDVFELFVTSIDGGGTPLKRNGPLVSGGDVRSFELASGDARLGYLADAEVSGRVELYGVPTFAGAPTKLNGALSGTKSVSDFQLTPSGTRAVYRADQLTQGQLELFSAPLDGSQPAVRLNAPLPQSFDDVNDFRFAPSGRLVYRAPAGPGAKLYCVPVDGSASALDLGALSVRDGYQVSQAGARVCFAVGSAPDFAIFSAPLDASSAPLALNDRPLWGGNTRILPVGAERVLYLTGEDHLDVEELYSARLDGVGPSVALAPPPPEGTPAGDVLSYQLTPDGSQALYTADRRGNGIYELFRRDAEGRGPAQRVHAPLVTGQELAGFRVTADSTRVVYRLHDGNYQLFSAPLDGSAAEVRLSPDLGGQHDVGETVLSHDSRWVVFSGNLDSNDSTEIYRVPVDGSAPPQRLNAPLPAGTYAGGPWLSADDSRVVYRQQGPGGAELYSVPLDLGAPPVRLNAPLVPGGSVRFHYNEDSPISPDSTRVVYGADQDVFGAVELYSVPLDGSAPPTRLSLGAGLVFDVRFTPVFRISADSTRVAYFADPDGDGQFTLFSAALAGGGALLALGPIVPASSSPDEFLLSADSTRAVYRGAGGQLLVARLDGGAPPLLLATLAPQDGLLEFALTPDSSRAVYRGRTTNLGPAELFSVPLDGSAPAQRLHGPLPADAGVGTPLSDSQAQVFQLTPDSRRVVFVGDLRVAGQFELYSAPLDASAAPRVESGPLVGGGDATSNSYGRTDFRLSPRGERVFYLADQEQDDVFELFATFLTRSARRAETPAPRVR